MTSSKHNRYQYDDTCIYYRSDEGNTFTITFAGLAAADGSDRCYKRETIALGSVRVPSGLSKWRPDAEVPVGWTNIDDPDYADHLADLPDALDMWSDYCNRSA